MRRLPRRLYQTKYFIITNPPINITVNPIASQLKYLSMKLLICGPNRQIRNATKKNLAPRLTMEAKRNIGKFIKKAPAEIVNTLYGSGVKPAVKIIQKLYSTYIFLICSKTSGLKPGMWLKKNNATEENSFGADHQTK